MTQDAKELLFEDAARDKLREGIDQLADVVSVTLGPRGRNVGIETSWGAPTITNDGCTIVSGLEAKDQFVDAGIKLGREVATKMKDACGDGTTTAIVLLRALVRAGVRNIAAGASPIQLKRGMERAVAELIAQIETMATPVQSDTDLDKIATSAASGSSDIGATVAEALRKVKRTGVVSIEDGKTTETVIEMSEGMQIDRGYISPYFATDSQLMIAEMHSPRILITDKKISSAHDILTLLQSCAASGEELLIIADDVDSDALSTLVVNKLRKVLKVCAIKAPGFGDRKKALLGDLAVLTGARVLSDETGDSLREIDPAAIGTATKVTIGKEKTVFVSAKGHEKAVAARIQQIELELSKATSSYDKDKLQERKAALQGGVAIIRVGGSTEPEIKQRKQLFQDSLNSTKAALEKGVVAGGGMALWHAAKRVREKNAKLSKEESVGYDVVLKACTAPAKLIIENSGADPLVVLGQIEDAASEVMGFNAQSERVENLAAAGVMDPAKVVTSALNYAAANAGVILLSEVLIGQAPEEPTESKA